MHYIFISKLTNSNIDLSVIDSMVCKDCDIPWNPACFSLQFNIICYIGTIVIRDMIFNQEKFDSIIYNYPYTHVHPEIALKYLNGDYLLKFS